MEISNPDFSDLISQGSLKEEKKIGHDQINRLINRAKKDLETAKTLLESDDVVSMNMVYNALFHSANALIGFYGYRSGEVRQHAGLIEATSRILGKEIKDYILRFNKLRKKRNLLEYQAIFDFSKNQIENNLEEAKKFVELIDKFIAEKMGQQSLDLEPGEDD